jgi:hypothetical protein
MITCLYTYPRGMGCSPFYVVVLLQMLTKLDLFFYKVHVSMCSVSFKAVI